MPRLLRKEQIMAIRQEGNTYYGLSTDTKPTGAVLNGREFREMDTGKKYLFDAENGEWLEQPEEGGGGGGGSSTLSGLTDVDISNPSDGQTLVYNATSGKWENGAGGGGALIIEVTEVTAYDDDPEGEDPFMIGNVSVTLNQFQEAFTTSPKPVYMRIPNFVWFTESHFSYADSEFNLMVLVNSGNPETSVYSNPQSFGLKEVGLYVDEDSGRLMFFAALTRAS